MDGSAYAALPRVVLDNGSGVIKLGLASNKKPPLVFPNCVGQPKKKFTGKHSSGSAVDDDVDGDASRDDRGDSFGNLAISEACYSLFEYFCNRPHSNGLLQDPNRQRLIWDRLIGRNPAALPTATNLNLLSINPSCTCICITEPNLCPVQCRQAAAEILFEDYGFSMVGFISAQQASSFLYDNLIDKTGHSTSWIRNIGFHSITRTIVRKASPLNSRCCMVLDVGFGNSHVVPYVNGEPVQVAALRTSLAGSQVNAYMKNVLAQRSINLEFNELVVQHIKEDSCYVSQNFDLELRAAKQLQKLNGSQLHHLYNVHNYSSKNRKWILKHFTSHNPQTPPLLNKNNEHLISQLARGEFESLEGVDLKVDFVMDASQEDSNSNEEFNNSGDEEEEEEEEYENGESQAPLVDISIAETVSKYSDVVQTVDLFAERFTIPEMLFSPQDLNLAECGIVDMVYRIGGSTKFPGFVERFYSTLSSLLPHDWNIGIYTTLDPALATYYGAQMWTMEDSVFLTNAMSRMYKNGVRANMIPHAILLFLWIPFMSSQRSLVAMK
ncbi:bifunctional ATPase [Babesia duncani]|uniref:Bifunctional ATPase n=1 Tax=Babesia duncani TaxID=323732 RepID=A0AAD9PLZ9_9APIC|nr:bifunctional ATPase [Babesia duncani]